MKLRINNWDIYLASVLVGCIYVWNNAMLVQMINSRSLWKYREENRKKRFLVRYKLQLLSERSPLDRKMNFNPIKFYSSVKNCRQSLENSRPSGEIRF